LALPEGSPSSFKNRFHATEAVNLHKAASPKMKHPPSAGVPAVDCFFQKKKISPKNMRAAAFFIFGPIKRAESESTSAAALGDKKQTTSLIFPGAPRKNVLQTK